MVLCRLLTYNGMQGTLPNAWSAMSSLAFLSLSLNGFQGTVPESWSVLSLADGL
jgi:hypothetical protein